MILHPAPPGLIAIRQSAHALLSFQIAEHWGNRETPRPSPRADVLAAVMLHDGGWDDHELPPRLAPDGRPLAFDSAPVEERVQLWRGAVAAAAPRGRYPAYLVSHHVSHLAETYSHHPHPEFLAEEASRREALRASLLAEPRWSQVLASGQDLINRDIVRLCDAIAVHLSRGAKGAVRLPELPHRDGRVPLELEAVAPRAYRLRPWPLIGRRLDLVAEGSRLPAERFESEEALRLAWTQAPTVVLRWSLLAPATPA